MQSNNAKKPHDDVFLSVLGSILLFVPAIIYSFYQDNAPLGGTLSRRARILIAILVLALGLGLIQASEAFEALGRIILVSVLGKTLTLAPILKWLGINLTLGAPLFLALSFRQPSFSKENDLKKRIY